LWLEALQSQRQAGGIYLGTLDAAPNGIVPIDEGWVKRREAWQLPIEGAGQHREDVVGAPTPTRI